MQHRFLAAQDHLGRAVDRDPGAVGAAVGEEETALPGLQLAVHARGHAFGHDQVGGGVAAYLLLTQLAQVDLSKVIASASQGWALATVVFAALTFAGASLALSGSINMKLRFVRTYMTQLAVAFSGLVAPAAIGNIALNTRYLQKAGAEPAVAAASETPFAR